MKTALWGCLLLTLPVVFMVVGCGALTEELEQQTAAINTQMADMQARIEQSAEALADAQRLHGEAGQLADELGNAARADPRFAVPYDRAVGIQDGIGRILEQVAGLQETGRQAAIIRQLAERAHSSAGRLNDRMRVFDFIGGLAGVDVSRIPGNQPTDSGGAPIETVGLSLLGGMGMLAGGRYAWKKAARAVMGHVEDEVGRRVPVQTQVQPMFVGSNPQPIVVPVSVTTNGRNGYGNGNGHATRALPLPPPAVTTPPPLNTT
jgi:hypothetical protein